MMMRYFDIVFPQGKKKALTFSFDDGVLQDRRLVAMMNRCGVKGTFNLNSGKFGRKQGDISFYEHPAMTDVLPETEIRTLYAGHEVACHGRYHLPPTMYPSAVMTQEYAADISALERLTGLPVHGGAYANGVLTEETERILRGLDMDYFRTVERSGGFDMPENWMRLSPTCHFYDADAEALAERFLAQNVPFGPQAKMLYIWGHAYELDGHACWDKMDALLTKLSGRSEIWYATNGEIAAYWLASRRLRLSVDCTMVENPTAYTIWFEANGRLHAIAPAECLRLAEEE